MILGFGVSSPDEPESILTFMSIISTIQNLEAQGSLLRYVPQRTLKPARRRLYLSPRMNQLLNDQLSPVNLLVGRGHIEAALTFWTIGDRIYDDGRHPSGPGFLKRLEGPPPDVWEIRVTNPTPQARVFGRFAEPDTFIATDMHTRGYLGKKGSAAWAASCQQCADDWYELFPNNPAMTGSYLSQFVTENRDDFAL